MAYQNIDASISPADLQSIKDAFATIKQKLPFLVNLSNDERKSIVKTGPNSLTFVTKALSAAQANSSIFPDSFDDDAFKRDVDLFAVLTELVTLVNQMAEQIDDTRLAVGGEAMQEAMQTYQYIKTASKTEPGLKALADDLGERFKRASVPAPPTPPPHP